MGRAPCCEKMGLKRGPWTRDEDVILVNYINQNGHENWRALPKLAGLLRCGKSCRLRWMNYLRPDIKRGNFTEEEERTIIRLHEEIGNRWSVIAAKLPGRTDNEIKNVWHTHLKKRLNKIDYPKKVQSNFHTKSEPISPLHSSSPMSSSTTTTTITTMDGVSNFPEMDESFWSEVFSADDSDSNQITDKRSESCSPMSSLCHEMSSSTTASAAPELPEMDGSFWSEFFSAPDLSSDVLGANSAEIPLNVLETSYRFEYIKEEGMDFWYDLFTSAGETVPLQLPESL